MSEKPDPYAASARWDRLPLPAGGSSLGRIFDGAGLSLVAPSAVMMPWRDYPGRALVSVCAGIRDAYYEDESGFRKKLDPGDVILVRPGLKHRYGANRGGHWAEFFISFDGPVFDMLEASGVFDAHGAPVFYAGDIEPRMRRCFRGAAGEKASMVAAVGRLVALLTELSVVGARSTPTFTGQDAWINKACAWLGEDGATVAEVTKQLAPSVGLSEGVLRKRFARLVGEPMDGFRCRLRLERAIGLLEETSMPMKEIAFKLGFSNEQHFSRTISSATGFTPGEMRARIRFMDTMTD